jgi:hypothetical protein
MIISIDTEKANDKIQVIHDKNSQKNRNRKELPQLGKEHLKKTSL